MQKKITTFLTYDGRAEEAMNLYTSVIPNSRITSTRYYGEAGPGEAGSLMTGTFELDIKQLGLAAPKFFVFKMEDEVTVEVTVRGVLA